MFKFKNSRTTPVVREILKTIRQKFKIAFHYLKKNHDVFILLGSKGSGKTTLLADSDLALNSPSEKELTVIKPTKQLDWWFGSWAAFLDLSGKYALPHLDQQDVITIWEKILRYYKRWIRRFPYRILLVITANELTQSHEEIEILIQRLSRQLISFKEPVRVSFVITHCDLLSGFKEFFSDLSIEEQHQPFGFQLQGKITDQLTKLFKQVNDRLYWRLYYEPNMTQRAQLKEFPFEFEKLCVHLKECLLELPADPKINYEAVYFTASTLAASSSFYPAPFNVYSKPKKFFISGAFNHIKKNAHIPLVPKIEHKPLRWLAWPIAALLIAGIWYGWNEAYKVNKNALTFIQQQSASGDPKSLDYWLNLSQGLGKYYLKFIAFSGLTQGYQQEKKITKQYEEMLQQDFLPSLQKILLDQIRNDVNNKNIFKLHNSLKVYLLLLAHPVHDREGIIYWFSEQWRKIYPNDLQLQQQLQDHLDHLLSLKSANWERDIPLIQQAQQVMTSAPADTLNYLKLRDMWSTRESSIYNNDTIKQFIEPSELMVRDFYQKNNFQTINDKTIPEFVHKNNPTLSDAQKNQMIESMRKWYVMDYASHWRHLLENINFKPAQDLKQSGELLAQFANPQSDLYRLLRLIVEQGAMDKKLYRAPILDPHFDGVESFINQLNNAKPLTASMQQLANQLMTVEKNNDPLEASYQLVLQRYQLENRQDIFSTTQQWVQTLSDPIKTWMQTPINTSWNQLITNAKDYLNQHWEKEVIPEYKEKIANRYPLMKDAKQDVALNDFTQFFGPNGTLERFFKKYLVNFVNISGNYWTWKTVDGKPVPIAQSTLEAFLRASLIQQMFFTDNKAAPSVTFSLTSTNVSTTVKSFVLTLDGQTSTIRPNENIIQTFTWPTNHSNTASAQFVLADGVNPTLTTQGPWAMWRLFDQVSIQPTNNPRAFTLTFQQNDHIASFQIITSNLVNPFIPGILNKFSLPEKLE